jgi:hypothetical protein
MSTGFSFVPARRRSREAQGALEPAADGDGGAGECRSEGRKPPVEGEGPSADGRGTGRVHDERGAKRSGCVSAGLPQIAATASAHQETAEPRH